jgi:hypothetical protein
LKKTPKAYIGKKTVTSTNGVGKLGYLQETESRAVYLILPEINSKWIKELKVRP